MKVWHFIVEVVNNNIKNPFDAQTDMEWLTFQDRAHSWFERPPSEVQLVYRIGTGVMSYLAGEDDWDDAMCKLRGKIRVARSRQTSMEIRNVVSDTRNTTIKFTHGDCL